MDEDRILSLEDQHILNHFFGNEEPTEVVGAATPVAPTTTTPAAPAPRLVKPWFWASAAATGAVLGSIVAAITN